MLILIASILAATIPTLFLVWIIWWADRYEREPVRLLTSAFFWGAIPAIILAVIVELMAGTPFESEGIKNELIQSAIIAPIVEEAVKGMALLGLIRFARAEIDGVLDGVIYGALVGAGFAMTENFFYFLTTESVGDWATIVFLRAFLFGLNHIFYTAIQGAAVGYALRFNSKGTRKAIMLAGLILAMAAHAFHNFSVTITANFPPVCLASILMNWGGALVMLLIVLLSLQKERQAIKNYLSSDAAPPISQRTQKWLMSAFPPKERLFPNWPWLPDQRRQENQLYQAIAEISLRRQRLDTAREDQRPRLEKEIILLQKTITTLSTLTTTNVAAANPAQTRED